MARRRNQRTGSLFNDGRWWRLRWRDSVRGQDGTERRIHRNTIIGPSVGPRGVRLTEREAQRAAQENILSRIEEQSRCPRSAMTLSQFVVQRFEPDIVWTLKHAGKLHYDYCFGRILPVLGDKRLCDVRAEHIQALVRGVIAKGRSVQTAAHLRNALSAIFKHAKAAGFYVGENPASLVRLPEMQRAPRFAYNFDQARAVLQALPTPVAEMVFLSFVTSLNVAELCGLRWRRMNLTADAQVVDGESLPAFSLAVRENFYRGKFGSVKTGKRLRVVPLPEAAVVQFEQLRHRPHFTGPDDIVFAARTGRPIDAHNTASRIFRPISKALGVPVTWHVFRHTAATLLEQVGMSRSDRIAMLGHASGAMTDWYTHSDIERRRESVGSMANRLQVLQ